MIPGSITETLRIILSNSGWAIFKGIESIILSFICRVSVRKATRSVESYLPLEF
jgi:hypothetical protein